FTVIGDYPDHAAVPDGLQTLQIKVIEFLKYLHVMEGKLVYALSQKDRLSDFTEKLLGEAGFSDILSYRVSPDYLYTTEIYAEDYKGGGAGDYLLIAK
ncbi:MAG: hypothetical protein J6Y86_09245, partial [Pseudobutyrivibrio sp.]|nr:hypothetical protein [Pseudobutyrivibrio sp.]